MLPTLPARDADALARYADRAVRGLRPADWHRFRRLAAIYALGAGFDDADQFIQWLIAERRVVRARGELADSLTHLAALTPHPTPA